MEKIKNAEIWADIKFVPSDPNRETITETTKKIQPEESKFKKVIFHIKEIFKLFR